MKVLITDLYVCSFHFRVILVMLGRMSTVGCDNVGQIYGMFFS